MRSALVHVMPLVPASEPPRRRGLTALLFGVGVGVVLVGSALVVGFDAMPAGSGTQLAGWRALTPSPGKQEIADAVPVGKEAELPLYACRAPIGRNMHVGRIRSDFGGCHIGFDGKETEIAGAETLAVTWRPGPGAVGGALIAGTERVTAADGSQEIATLMLCRAQNQGAAHPGQIRAGEKECSFGFGGRRATSAIFDILQAASWMQWAPATARSLPDTAVIAGSEGGEAFFACRASDREGLRPGKIKRNGPGCSIVSDNRELIVNRFEVLVTRWLPGQNGSVPVAAIPVGWEETSLQYACRARTRDSVQVGKVNDSLGGCHIGMLGREVVLPDYEVLSQ